MGFLSSLEDAGRGIAHTAESGWDDVSGAADGVGDKVSRAWNGTVDGVKDAAHSLADPNSWASRIGHTALDGVGMVPVVGTVSEGINAGWYAAQGDYGDAALAGVSAIPIAGDFADGARLAKDGVELAHDGIDAVRAEKTASTVAKDLHTGETAAHEAAPVAHDAAPAAHDAGPAHETTPPAKTHAPPKPEGGPAVTKGDVASLRERIGVPKTNTVGVGKTDVPGLEGKTFEGASPTVRREAGMPKQEEGPIQSPSTLARGRNHAEQDIANQFSKAVDKAGLKPSDLDGHTLTMRIDNETGICTTCMSGLRNPDVDSGVLKQLSERYPDLNIHVIVNEPGANMRGLSDFTIRGGEIVK